MLALSFDVFTILLLGVTTSITIAIQDDRIRKEVLTSFVVLGKHISEQNKSSISKFFLSINDLLESIARYVRSAQGFSQTRVEAKHLKVDINHYGKNYTLLLPYSTRDAVADKKYYIVRNGKEELLEWVPGVPLLVTAEDLGVDDITHKEEEPDFGL